MGYMVRVTLLPGGVPRLLAPLWVPPGNGKEVLQLCEVQLCQLPDGNLICCHSAFGLKILARTNQLPSNPLRGIRSNLHFYCIIMKMELQRKPVTRTDTQYAGQNWTPFCLIAVPVVQLQTAFCHITDNLIGLPMRTCGYTLEWW